MKSKYTKMFFACCIIKYFAMYQVFAIQTDSACVQVIWYIDYDGDLFGSDSDTILNCYQPFGYVLQNGDCNDNHSEIFPGAGSDICNGMDDDCDGIIDNGLAYQNYYSDSDEDTFGNPLFVIIWCTSLSGFVLNDLDCDDSNPLAFPGETAASRCDEYNGFDDDCDGTIDEDGMQGWYVDADEDGFGDRSDINPIYSNCSPISGRVSNNFDCDDLLYELNPNSLEQCNNLDDNCNGIIDEDIQIEWHADIDQDGFGNFAITVFSCTYPDPAIYIYSNWVENNLDCYDEDALAHPGMPELCDGIDNNCDGTVDFNLAVFYLDLDHDYYGDINSPTSCDPSVFNNPDWIWDDMMFGGDCDDNNAAIPAEFNIPEICNGIDDNCNGYIDDGFEYVYYFDNDLDGFGDISNTFYSVCPDPISGYIYDNTDCNDVNHLVNPDAIELCNSYDDDCNGIIDDITWYLDLDGDGYGNPNVLSFSCPQPFNFVGNNFDCNDSIYEIHLNAVEICDGLDNDCDGDIDEDQEVATYYFDNDEDGFGNPFNTKEFCSEELSYPNGYIFNSGDCNDYNANIFPFADEICDGLDNNCDGEVDEGFNKQWHADIDHDGYGNFAITALSCDYPNPAIYIYDSWVHNDDDCHDENALSHPGAIEFCDGEDNNCNSLVDETAESFILYADLDFDNFIDYSNSWTDCFQLPATGNYITEDKSYGIDCNDNDPEIPFFFIQEEICNGLDDDCDGSVDEALIDATIYSSGSTNICAGSTAFLYCTIFSPLYQWYKNDIAIPSTNQSFLIISEPGNYKLSITQITDDGNCNAISNTIIINIQPLPLAKAKIQGSNNLCGRHQVKLKSNECVGCNYQWFKNGSIIAGAINPNYNTTTVGNFQIRITNADGCSALSNSVSVIKTCKENVFASFTYEPFVQVYPNPASEKLNLSININQVETTRAIILIYSILGQKLYEEVVYIIDGSIVDEIALTDEFSNGLYFLKIQLNHTETIHQIVIER